jgi:hypothetical protein
MSKPTNKLTWVKAQLGEDSNWWASEISDPIHWDVDGLGIIDPKQFQYMMELLDPLSDYGLKTELIEDAFYSFGIENFDKKEQIIHLKRIQDSILDSDELIFALPDVLDDDKGPYADFIDHITRLRIKLLNDLIDFSSKLTIEELEEDIRETQNQDFMEGRASHYFNEIVAILEYVPAGFVLDSDDEDDAGDDCSVDDELANVIPDSDVSDEGDEPLLADDTMKWDEDEEDASMGTFEEPTSPPDEEADPA